MEPNQWEITYVNHLVQGREWALPSDLMHIFRGIPGLIAPVTSVGLESLSAQWHFKMPEDRGRIHVELEHAKTRGDSPRQVMVLKLTGRGPMRNEAELVPALDFGHEQIVKIFEEITSERAQASWGKQS